MINDSARESQRRKKIVLARVEKFKQDNNIEIKCISDHTLLYIRYIIDRMEKRRGVKFDDELKELIDRVYKETRANSFDIGVLVPSTLATAIIYYASIIHDEKIGRKLIDQRDLCEVLGTDNSVKVRTGYKKLVAFFNEKQIFFNI